MCALLRFSLLTRLWQISFLGVIASRCANRRDYRRGNLSQFFDLSRFISLFKLGLYVGPLGQVWLAEFRPTTSSLSYTSAYSAATHRNDGKTNLNIKKLLSAKSGKTLLFLSRFKPFCLSLCTLRRFSLLKCCIMKSVLYRPLYKLYGWSACGSILPFPGFLILSASGDPFRKNPKIVLSSLPKGLQGILGLDTTL